MSVTTDFLTKLKGYIEGITGIENVYDRRVTYADDEDWVSKFQSLAKDEYKGVEIWRSGKVKELTSFLNKTRSTYTFTIAMILGAKDSDDIISYNTLRDQADSVADLLDSKLTLDGTAVDSEFCDIGDIDLDLAVGNIFWRVELTKVIYKDVIEGSIS